MCIPAAASEVDIDEFLTAPFAVPMTRVEKWSKSGRTHDDNQALAAEFVRTFQKSGDERYARAAIKIFLAYAENYDALRQKFHNAANGGSLHAQLLDEAVWLVGMAESYDALLRANAVSSAERKKIEDGLFIPAVGVEMGGNMPNNHQWWYNAAIGAVGFAIGNKDFIRAAIDGERGFKFHIANQINDDGLIFEQAIAYQHYALDAYQRLANIAAAHGVDLYNLEVDDATKPDGINGKKSLKMMFDAYAYFAFPNGMMPAVKDSGPQGRSFIQSFYPDIPVSYKAHYNDPARLKMMEEYVAIQQQRDEGRVARGVVNPGTGTFALNGKAINGSTLFPTSGYAILRADASNPDAPAVNLTYGPYGGGHGHPDKLAVSFYANGEIALPDIGRYWYENPMHQAWAKQTIAHNTVTVDRRSQKPMNVAGMSEWADAVPGDGGVLHSFIATKGLQVARASSNKAVDGVTLDRTVALFGGALIDVFDVSSAATHTYEYALHVNGKFLTSDTALMLDPEKPGKAFGYEYLKNIKSAAVPGQWITTWNTAGGSGLYIATLGPGGKALVADAPGNPDNTIIPMLVLRRGARNTRFFTIALPFKNPADVSGIHVSGDIKLEYVETAKEAAPAGVMFSSGGADHMLVLSPGGALYNINDWMRTDAAAVATTIPADGTGETDTFHNFRRINHGGAGFDAAAPIDFMQLSYEKEKSIRIDIETAFAGSLTIGDEIISGMTSDCPKLSLKINGKAAELKNPLKLAIAAGGTAIIFDCGK